MKTTNLSQIALIALGSNEKSDWGDAKSTVRAAITRLESLSESPLVVSPLYATAAFPAGSGPEFVNAAVALETTLDPAGLLAQLHTIEADAGRTRTARWGQRTLDLDLIGMGDLVSPDPETYRYWRDLPLAQQRSHTPAQLILPHPRLQDRAFVLIPLADVAAGWVHPVSGLDVGQMCAALTDRERAEVRAI